MKLSRLIIATLIAGFTFTSSAIAAETIVINGSTTVLPIIQKMAEVFMEENPDISISISFSLSLFVSLSLFSLC